VSLLWAAVGLVVACGAMATRLIGRQHEHERLYGRSPGWPRIHRPGCRRVPGLPHDGVLTGQEEVAIEEIGRQLRKDGRP
jgi:hypothetical protein